MTNGVIPKKIYLLGGAVVIVAVAMAAGFLFWKYHHTDTPDPSSNQQTSATVIAAVNKLYKVPAGEQPTVAQVQDKTKLGGQPFYSDAQNGDYVLIYKNAKLALLYRQSENILIKVGPINLTDQPTGGPAASGQ